MAQEDYLSGSQFGQVAGSLLASKRKQDKKSFKKALLATALFEGVGALQKQQKQTIMDNAQAVKEKYNDIFNLNKAEFDSYSSERDLLKRYKENPSGFLNEEAAKIIDNTDEAQAARVKWVDVAKEPNKQVRESMEAAFNKARQDLSEKMQRLEVDPRITTRTFEEFNRRAKDEYMAALKLVEDDPTKKGLMRAAWNRIFKTEQDPVRAAKLQEVGIDVTDNLVTTNSELFDLQNELIKAKANRSTFRDSIDKEIETKQLIKPLIFKDKSKSRSEIYAQTIPGLVSSVNQLNLENFKDIDSEFYGGLIDGIIDENPDLGPEQIQAKAFENIITGNVNTEGYITRRGMLRANNELLIDNWTDSDSNEKRKLLENDFTMLFKLMDAYKAQGQDNLAQGLSIQYKDLYEDAKPYVPSGNEKTAYAEKFRQLDSEYAKERNANALAVISGNAVHAENYFMRKNKDWQRQGYTETDIQEAAMNYVIKKAEEGDSTNTRMTTADLLYLKPVNESIVDDLPDLINELKSARRNSELPEFKNQIMGMLYQSNLELDQDEIMELNKKVNDAFGDPNDTADKVIVTNGKVYNKSSIADEIPSLSEVDFNATPGIGGYYLKNADLLISKMDLQGLSDGQLLTLRATTLPSGPGDEGTLPQKLGLPKDISLDESKTSGMIPGLDIGDVFRAPKVREQLRQRIEDEMEIRMSKGKVFGRDRSSSNPATVMMMAKRKDFEDIPEDWWKQYVISNPIGISPPRGAAGRGTKYNPQG